MSKIVDNILYKEQKFYITLTQNTKMALHTITQ